MWQLVSHWQAWRLLGIGRTYLISFSWENQGLNCRLSVLQQSEIWITPLTHEKWHSELPLRSLDIYQNLKITSSGRLLIKNKSIEDRQPRRLNTAPQESCLYCGLQPTAMNPWVSGHSQPVKHVLPIGLGIYLSSAFLSSVITMTRKQGVGERRGQKF